MDSNKIKSYTLCFITGCITGMTSIYLYKLINKTKLINNTINIIKNKKWKVGTNQPLPFNNNNNWLSYNSKDLINNNSIYSLLISTVIPRPIALITSINTNNNIINCAPFSYCGLVSHNPPLLNIGICLNRNEVKKDTLINIESNGQLVVNIVSNWALESMNHTSGNFPSDVSEINVSGLSTLPSDMVKPPRIGESAVQLECEVYDLNPVYNDNNTHTATIVTAKILKIHILEDVLTDECKNNDNNTITNNKIMQPVVDYTKLQAIGRLGGNTYTLVNNGYDIARPNIT